MAAELIRGQNHPLSDTRLEIRVSAGQPVVAGVTLNDDQGRMRDAAWIAHPASPRLPGIEVSPQAAADHRLAVDLDALPADVHRANVLLALVSGVGGPASFGAVAAPAIAVTGLDGTEIVRYTVTDLTSESAIVAVELYRRNGAWKVRALGQGYAGGLAAMLEDQGLPQARQLAGTINEAVVSGMTRAVAAPPPPAGQPGQPGQAGGTGRINLQHPNRPAPSAQPAAAAAPAPGQPAQPVAGDAAGHTMEERLYNQVWGMFEDLARTAAAYRSAVDFADSRMERELDQVLSDPATRVGPAADLARTGARAKHSQLVDQARGAFERDVAQLVAESEVVEPALPLAFARWDNPVWQAYRVPGEAPMALRLGDLSLPERVDLRIPMLVRLPLQRGLWVDAGRHGTLSPEAAALDADGIRGLAAETATAVVARLLAVHPVGAFTVQVIDPAGSAAAALAPLLETGALREAPGLGHAGVTTVLDRLTQRVDLVQMAIRSRAVDALPPDLDMAEQLLVVHDFPHGFDDRAVTQLRYLADEGPSVGVHLVMVADREDARGYGPVLDPLWRSLLRVTPVPDDHLVDPWVGHSWTYEPPLAPGNSRVVSQVLEHLAVARQRSTP
ncbi:TerD family protein [Streptomyces hainanensis]|uniref:Export associated protein n=1 Tax=Streptomyces hainanensis TaxID=402648 RepID=A0A4R4TC30_9ACTN|nr:TerD family protein [Streptomyces hainanensis]TDC75048.1 export associated protein [Streptomyces hainanensis]